MSFLDPFRWMFRPSEWAYLAALLVLTELACLVAPLIVGGR